MLLEKTYKQIADEFIGDNESPLYKYKSGPELVDFFNEYFNVKDYYGQDFPSRSYYVVEYLRALDSEGKLEEFFSIILSDKYLRVYEDLTRQNIKEGQEKRIEFFNSVLDKEDLLISFSDKKIFLRPYNDTSSLEFIGEGGFANVYKVDDYTAKKVLKDEFLNDKSIKHRFKREFEIIKGLQHYKNIIPIKNFNEVEHSYEMTYCKYNLTDYLKNYTLNVDEKLKLIKKIIEIVKMLHQNNVIHRDLNPYNILINENHVYLSDFGIGKDMNRDYSHLTQFTKGIGNFFYTAPEQLEGLEDSSKESDVYSLGKLINYIFNDSPHDENHMLQALSSIASLNNPEDRFEDAIAMQEDLKTILSSNESNSYKQSMEEKILTQQLDSELVKYFHSLNSRELVDTIGHLKNSASAFIYTLNSKPSSSYNLLKEMNENITSDYSYEDYDKFSDIAMEVLNNSMNKYNYNAQMEAAKLLYYVATKVNRFNSQDRIELLISRGIDLLLERILTGDD